MNVLSMAFNPAYANPYNIIPTSMNATAFFIVFLLIIELKNKPATKTKKRQPGIFQVSLFCKELNMAILFLGDQPLKQKESQPEQKKRQPGPIPGDAFL
jgi:hypothetical protein